MKLGQFRKSLNRENITAVLVILNLAIWELNYFNGDVV